MSHHCIRLILAIPASHQVHDLPFYSVKNEANPDSEGYIAYFGPHSIYEICHAAYIISYDNTIAIFPKLTPAMTYHVLIQRLPNEFS